MYIAILPLAFTPLLPLSQFTDAASIQPLLENKKMLLPLLTSMFAAIQGPSLSSNSPLAPPAISSEMRTRIAAVWTHTLDHHHLAMPSSLGVHREDESPPPLALPPPPPTHQHPLQAILALPLHHSDPSLYHSEHTAIRALYHSMLPRFVTRLHDLAMGSDVVIAITTAKRCHSDPSSHMTTLTPSNSTGSSVMAPSPRMHTTPYSLLSLHHATLA